MFDNLASQFEIFRNTEEKEWNESKDEIVRYFEYHLSQATKKKDRKKLDKEYGDKIVEISEQLEERLLGLDTLYENMQNNILDDVYYPSFVFQVNGFSVVVAKVGINKIRLRTIYGNPDLPNNTFISNIKLKEVLNR